LKFINDPRVAWAQVNDIIEDLPAYINMPRDESLISGAQWYDKIDPNPLLLTLFTGFISQLILPMHGPRDFLAKISSYR
jgi:hypothetical protein